MLFMHQWTILIMVIYVMHLNAMNVVAALYSPEAARYNMCVREML